MRVIETRDKQGQKNGYVVPLWNAREDAWRPDQVYLTAVSPGRSKGPHLHHKRVGRFFCIHGNVDVITRKDGFYHVERIGDGYDSKMVEVPTGVAAELRNRGIETALIINMPTPGWAPDDRDEYDAEDWNPPK